MAKDLSLWNKIMKAALQLPGVTLDRSAYLFSALKDELSPAELQKAIDERPITVLSQDVIDHIATGAITYHTATVTSLSTLTGLPGGPAIMASIPADLAQYYYHVFVLAQKLAYLYGYPDMRDENAKLTDDAMDMLTLFVGVMMGAKLANDVIKDISKDLALQLAKKLPQGALTRSVYYPLVKQVAKRIGMDISSNAFSKTFGKFIPLLGGIVSGSITYATFSSGTKRLQKTLQMQMQMIANTLEDSFTGGEEETHLENGYTNRLSMQVLVNMALMSEDAKQKKLSFIREQVEHTCLSTEEKLEIIQALQNEQTFRVDLSDFKDDTVLSTILMRRLIETMRLSGETSATAKIYLNKISRELGFSPADVEEFLDI